MFQLTLVCRQHNSGEVAMFGTLLAVAPKQAILWGTLGVLGPTRMRYGRAISAVRYVAGLMSNLVFDAYGSEGPAAEDE